VVRRPAKLRHGIDHGDLISAHKLASIVVALRIGDLDDRAGHQISHDCCDVTSRLEWLPRGRVEDAIGVVWSLSVAANGRPALVGHGRLLAPRQPSIDARWLVRTIPTRTRRQPMFRA
jgi:hypothetical protein